MSLIPYLLVAGYGLKLPPPVRPTGRGRRRDLIIAGIATVYTAFLIFAGGI